MFETFLIQECLKFKKVCLTSSQKFQNYNDKKGNKLAAL